MNPFVFLVIRVAGWMNRNQQGVIEYLQEEIRVLKELLGKKPRRRGKCFPFSEGLASFFCDANSAFCQARYA